MLVPVQALKLPKRSCRSGMWPTEARKLHLHVAIRFGRLPHLMQMSNGVWRMQMGMESQVLHTAAELLTSSESNQSSRDAGTVEGRGENPKFWSARTPITSTSPRSQQLSRRVSQNPKFF